jgi:hypothetical protein
MTKKEFETVVSQEYKDLEEKYEKMTEQDDVEMTLEKFVQEFPMPDYFIENKIQEYYNIFKTELLDESEQEEMSQIQLDYFPQFIYELIYGNEEAEDVLEHYIKEYNGYGY